jgi:large subunit ribosomal protein L22
MEATAITKYVRISPSKARDLAKAIQGLPVHRALEFTESNTRKAAFLIGKTLKSAIANAENNQGLSADELFVRQAWIEDGPVSGRWQPVARGMAHPIQKRTSHIKIVLTDQRPTGK